MVDPAKPSEALVHGRVLHHHGPRRPRVSGLARHRPRPAALLVIQEISGVNSHIRKVTDGFAADGYTAIAPCLFDRVRRGIELGYSAAEMQEGSGYTKQLTPENTLRDLAAAIAVVKHSG